MTLGKTNFQIFHRIKKKRQLTFISHLNNVLLLSHPILDEFLPQLFEGRRIFLWCQDFNLLPPHLQLFELGQLTKVPKITTVQLTQVDVIQEPKIKKSNLQQRCILYICHCQLRLQRWVVVTNQHRWEACKFVELHFSSLKKYNFFHRNLQFQRLKLIARFRPRTDCQHIFGANNIICSKQGFVDA